MLAALTGCAHRGPILNDAFARMTSDRDQTAPVADTKGDGAGWDADLVVHANYRDEVITEEDNTQYLLDTGDRLRVFVYGQPNLSRIYPVDHQGMISVPLIGDVRVRGMTTYGVDATLTNMLGREFVRDPQVTVDIQQTRPFFILGEVRNSGQYPFVSGMTVETAIAIAGGYTERASNRKFRISRRVNGLLETIHSDSNYSIKPGDTVFVYERFF